MAEPILRGILLGLFLSVFIGITFFMLIETSIRYGFKKAIYMNFGVLIGDIILLSIIWFMSKNFLQKLAESKYFILLASITFIIFGFYYILNSRSTTNFHKNFKTGNSVRLFFQGITVNIMNPSVSIFWTSAMALAISKYRFNNMQTFSFFYSALTVVLLVDLMKIYYASKIRKWITPRSMKKLYTAIGILLLLLGIKLIISIY